MLLAEGGGVKVLFRKLLNRTEGQGLVEMALVLPLLLVIFMGMIEFGRVFGSFLVINNLAREGARYGAVGHTDTEIKNIIITERAYLDAAKMTIIISPPPEPPENRGVGNALEVQVNYSLPLITPIISELLPNPFPLSAQCFMRIER
ncbi:MAG TPA: TadE/TadG family type IV pilus assembly protein [Syntrophomonadaceae bacterium]|nr:TadE/TadG family type IV pilus assembly protein [Syntrophomonadaceae bacterium]